MSQEINDNKKRAVDSSEISQEIKSLGPQVTIIDVEFDQVNGRIVNIKKYEKANYINTSINDESRFLNPYNFVGCGDFTPRYKFTPINKFNGHSGTITVQMKTETPLIIGNRTTDDPVVDGHKIVHFPRINGKAYIPASSLKGMIRKRVSIVSDSCFNHDYSKDNKLNYFSDRFDPTEDPKVIQRLKKGVIKKKNGKWYFIELDSAKVLTTVDRYNSEDKKIWVAVNRNSNIPEKISIKDSQGKTGIVAYNSKKRDRCRINLVNNLTKNTFSITNINNIAVNPNELNKTFPYIDLRTHKGKIYGIVRKLIINNKFESFKVKMISNDIDALKRHLSAFEQSESKDNVQYGISELFLKTAADIDTKTQDKVFFKFGEEDLSKYIDSEHGKEINDEVILQFRNIIAQRHENLKKDEIDNYLMTLQPKELKEGMLVYASINQGNIEYLSYTEVPRIPFRYGINSIVEKMRKHQCSDTNELCPACNIFGFIKENASLAGKVFFNDGNFYNSITNLQSITLKPLSSPKPSYYPFYLLPNRKGVKSDYNSENAVVGSKIYIFMDNVNLSNNEKTKLNSTVEYIDKESTFSFSIDFINLSNYELGLLLYAIDTKYKQQDIPHSLGMAKPYGFGKLSVNEIKLELTDRAERYKDILALKRTQYNNPEIFIDIFQEIQESQNITDFNNNLNKLNSLDKNSLQSWDIRSRDKFFNKPYIKELCKIGIFNPEDHNIQVKYPSKKDNSGELKGFEWFRKHKHDKNKTLFNPEHINDQGEFAENDLLDDWG